MNPYDIDITKLKISEPVTEEKDFIKLDLIAAFSRATSKMSIDEILEKTKLHRSDLSRLQVGSFQRFSIERLVGILNSLDLSVTVKVKGIKEKASVLAYPKK